MTHDECSVNKLILLFLDGRGRDTSDKKKYEVIKSEEDYKREWGRGYASDQDMRDMKGV